MYNTSVPPKKGGDMERLYTNKQWLEEQFGIPGNTIRTVAFNAGCDEKTVRRWMKKLGVEARDKAETMYLRQAVHSDVTAKGLEIVEGELLGDGSLQGRSLWSARYAHANKNRQYLVWLNTLLSDEGVQTGMIRHRVKNNGAEYYETKTKTHTAFYGLYQRFYPEGKKRLPLDLILTPTKCLHWYLGDGFRSKKRCVLATCAFHIDALKNVMSQLEVFHPHTRKVASTMSHPYGYGIVLTLDFLDHIGSCPSEIESIYGYKWDRSYE
jgi:hypothetical protein